MHRRVTAKLLLLALLAASIAETAFAQCHPPAQSAEGERTVFLALVLKKSGAVREVRVIGGPPMLTMAAIKAARKRRYKLTIETDSPADRKMTVAVEFPEAGGGVPKIHENIAFGVPSCIPTPAMVRISSEVMQTYLRNKVDPVYPPEAQTLGGGTLVLRVQIDKDGNVYKAEKTSGPDSLAPAATDAVKKWKYKPFLLNGLPTEVETTVNLGY